MFNYLRMFTVKVNGIVFSLLGKKYFFSLISGSFQAIRLKANFYYYKLKRKGSEIETIFFRTVKTYLIFL